MTRTVAGYTCWGNVNDSWLKISLKERHEGSLQLCTCSAPALKLGRRKKKKKEIEKWCCVGFTRALVVRQMTATHNLSSLVSLLEWGHRSWRRGVFSHTNEPLLRPLLMLCVCVCASLYFLIPQSHKPLWQMLLCCGVLVCFFFSSVGFVPAARSFFTWTNVSNVFVFLVVFSRILQIVFFWVKSAALPLTLDCCRFTGQAAE